MPRVRKHHPPRYARFTLILLLSLTLGLLTTVALAWALAAAEHTRGRRPAPLQLLPRSSDHWLIQRGESLGHTQFRMAHWDPASRSPRPPVLPPARRPGMPPWLELPHPGSSVLATDAYGLPMRCLIRSVELGDTVQTVGLRVGSAPNGLTLPTRPIPPGLAANAAIWTLPWLLLHAAIALTRQHRRRHDHCTRCGYDLRGTPNRPCPECGDNRPTHSPPVRSA